MAIRFDPALLPIIFAEVHRSLFELDLDEDHEELASMNQDWVVLKQLIFMDEYATVREFFSGFDVEKELNRVQTKFFADERLADISSTSLFRLISKDPAFAHRWSLKNHSKIELSKAFAIDLLRESLPREFIAKLCIRAEISPPSEAALPKKPEIEEVKKAQAVPKKRGKAQTALEKEAISSKKITSFFKFKS